MKRLMLAVVGLVTCLPLYSADLPVPSRIEQAMFGDHRSDSNKARNAYRHPVGTLTALGLDDGMTVLEIWPGGGWYTEVLAPVMRGKGQYVVASWDQDVEGQPQYRYRLHQALVEKFSANPGVYDQVAIIPFSPPNSASLGADNSFDLILTFRNAHGWVSDGMAEQVFAEFARVLKPGGSLGVVQHRAAAGTDPAVTAEMGYLSEAAVIELASGAGLYLGHRSEVNANPSDDRDHPEGVWSLPPGLAVCESIEDQAERDDCESPYLAIGESDRMTLRFVKPLD